MVVMLRRTMLVVVGVFLWGCRPGTRPPAAPQPREGTKVRASVGKSWDAVIDLFAERSIPIRTMERASGFIATEQLRADDVAERFYDCGAVLGHPIRATHASYNVVVRGDSSASSVRVNMRYVNWEDVRRAAQECTSTGQWEAQFEHWVRDRAEGGAVASSRNAVAELAASTETMKVARTGPIRGVETGAEVRLHAQRIAMVPISGWVAGWRSDTLYVAQQQSAPADIIVPLRWIERLEIAERGVNGAVRYRTVLGRPTR
jgi:hypothetical protein